MAPITTKWAVLSGYTISPNDFKTFMHSIEHKLEFILSNRSLPLNDYVHSFDRWRRHLPDSDQQKVPKLRLVYKPDADYSLAFDDTMEKFLFPTRWVTYRNENQLKTVQEPNDVDNAKLGEFAQYVASIGGKLPDSSSLGFGCKKDTHPSQDWGDW